MAERFRECEGHYPSRILADKIYRNRENLDYCKAHGIRLSDPALGRPRKDETRDKAQDYRDKCERVKVERRSSLAKRKCGMGLVTAKLRQTAAHVIAMSILVLNLRRIPCALWRLLSYLIALFVPLKKEVFVQETLLWYNLLAIVHCNFVSGSYSCEMNLIKSGVSALEQSCLKPPVALV